VDHAAAGHLDHLVLQAHQRANLQQ
jgi:hypothetical protein